MNFKISIAKWCDLNTVLSLWDVNFKHRIRMKNSTNWILSDCRCKTQNIESENFFCLHVCDRLMMFSMQTGNHYFHTTPSFMEISQENGKKRKRKKFLPFFFSTKQMLFSILISKTKTRVCAREEMKRKKKRINIY